MNWIRENKNDYSTLNYTVIQRLPNRKSHITNPSQYLEFHNKSLHNQTKHTWCTGLVFTPHGRVLGVIRIDCDLKINASFFCQHTFQQDVISSHTIGSAYSRVAGYWEINDCDSGWAHIGQYCFLMIEQNQYVSWKEANRMCHNHSNASLVNIVNTSNKSDFVLSTHNLKNIFSLLNTMGRNTKRKSNDFDPQLASYLNSMQTLLGSRERPSDFLKLKPLRDLSKKVTMLLREISWPIQIYTEDCSYIKPSKVYKTDYSIIPTACNQMRHITHLVCQKDVIREKSTCHHVHYACIDGTCIINEYLCDGNKDCYQGDDELNCEQIHYLTAEDLQHLQHNSWWLHSTICSIVSLTLNGSSNCIMPHSVCDNIPDISLETLFCHYGNKSQDTTRNVSDLHKQNLFLDSAIYKSCTTPLDLKLPNKIDSELCEIIQCPFMFRCENSYCIPIENVCDGFSDCPYQSDEVLCGNTSCPGMLKCRGEHRCLPDYLICDDKVDCMYSSDDEFSCKLCPPMCSCSGYTILCFDFPPANYIAPFKAIFVRYEIESHAELYWGTSVVFLDISYCKITNHLYNISAHSLIIYNISNNLLDTLNWRLFLTLKHIHTIDASHNNIENIFPSPKRPTSLEISLITLFLSYNKITVFRKAMFNNLQNLEYINIEHNSLKFVERGIFDIVSSVRLIHSSETVVCCLTATVELKCSVDNNVILPGNDCIIYSSRYWRIQWDVLAAVGLFCCIFVAFYHAFLMTGTTTFYLFFINHILNCSLLFSCTMATVHLKVSRYASDIGTYLDWFNSILKITSYGLVVSGSLFSIMRDMCLILKTLFPFKHQCRWICHIRWGFLIIWFLQSIHGWIVTAVSNQADLINLENTKKNTFWMTYLYVIIGVNSVMLLTSSLCYKVLLSVKSRTPGQHRPRMSHKFKVNVHGMFVCQITFVFVGNAILLMLPSVFSRAETLSFILSPCFYYVFAVRGHMTVAGAIWVNMLFKVFKQVDTGGRQKKMKINQTFVQRSI